MRALAPKLRAAMTKVGASAEVYQAVMQVLTPKKVKPIKITWELKRRISELLDKPGARCILIRNKASVRVYTFDSLSTLSAVAKKHKPWKNTRASHARDKATSASEQTAGAAS